MIYTPTPKPSEVCKLPPSVITDIIWDVLSDNDRKLILGDIAVFYPEVFQEALLERGRVKTIVRERRARLRVVD